MPHAIIRGESGRRHEVDFGDAPVRVEIYASEETVEIFIEPDFETHAEERRRLPSSTFPATCLAKLPPQRLDVPRTPVLHPQWPRSLDTQPIPDLVRPPVSYPAPLCSVPKNILMLAVQIRSGGTPWMLTR
jgi:hypothetical protein